MRRGEAIKDGRSFQFNERYWSILFGLIAVFYICLRLWKLTASCLWFDEIFSVHAAEYDWFSLVRFVAQDLIHPPLFYVLLKLWIAVGGESLFWLRFFSVFFSIVSLVPFYLLCRQLKLKNVAIALAAVFFAANGALIKYAQEVRMYSLLLCLSLFSLWLFARYFNYGKNYKTLILINILLVYTHYFGWFVVLPQIVLIAVLQNIKIRQMLIMFGVTLVSYVPWGYAVWQSSKSFGADLAQNIGWMGHPNFRVLINFVFDAIEPFYFQQSGSEPETRVLITIPLFLISFLAVFFYFLDWKSEKEKTIFYLLPIFILFPIILTFVMSIYMSVSIWGTRHLIITFVPIYVLAAKFLTEISYKTLRYILLSFVFIILIFAFVLQINYQQPKFGWCGWENLAQQIDKSQPQTIYVFEDLAAYHFWFALRDSDQVKIIKINNFPGLEFQEDKAYFLPRGFEAVGKIDANQITGENFWIAYTARDWDETKSPIKSLAEKGYKFGEPTIFEAEGLKDIFVEVKKK